MQNQSYANIRDGRKTVTSAGTPERIVATNTPCKKVEITALESNTDVVVIGDSTVVAGSSADAGATRRGTPLTPGQTYTIYVEDLYTLYVDAVVSGNGISYVYFF